MSLIPHKEERVGLVIVANELKSVACFPIKESLINNYNIYHPQGESA